MRTNEVAKSDELKTIYFKYPDTLLLAHGEIITSNYDSEAIESIRQLVDTYPELITEPALVTVPVRGVDQYIITQQMNIFSAAKDTVTLSQDDVSVVASRARSILQEAVTRGSSDVHIELYSNQTRIEARIDGRLVSLQQAPEYDYGLSLFGYLFNELGIDTDDNFYVSVPNNGRLELELDTNDGPRTTIWRMSYIPAKNKGGQVTLRWLNKDLTVPKLDELGWEQGQVDTFRAFLASASGIALMAGQVGSGKTTTHAAAINELKGKGRSINTLEEPVEFDLGVIQTTVINQQSDDDGFAEYSRLLLRHDVDIEMHGEVREHKGAMSVCRKGETGQLMLSTLHTSSAVGIAHTLHSQMGVPSSLIAAPDLMKLWMYQTLVRTLCPHCALSLEDGKKQLSSAENIKLDAWLEPYKPSELSNMKLRKLAGCEHCNNGEQGRTSLVEILVLDDEDRQFIMNQDYLEWVKVLRRKGFKNITDHATLKILRGDIDIFTADGRVNGLLSLDAKSVYKNIFEGGG